MTYDAYERLDFDIFFMNNYQQFYQNALKRIKIVPFYFGHDIVVKIKDIHVYFSYYCMGISANDEANWNHDPQLGAQGVEL